MSEALQPYVDHGTYFTAQESVCHSACTKVGVIPKRAVSRETRAGIANHALVGK